MLVCPFAAGECTMNDHLMTSRRFAPLFWTQFLSAFNDNFLKNTLVFLILFTLAADEAASLVTLGGRHLHGPLPAAVGAGRRVGRPFRQGGHGAIAEARRDRRGRPGGRRHRAVLDPGTDVRAVLLRRHLGPVRPGEIRHLARSSRAQGTAARQCLDRVGDLRCHSRRHDRRWHRLGRGHQRRSTSDR